MIFHQSKSVCFALYFFAFIFSSPDLAEAGDEKVRHVIDGDTVVLENDQRVRLIGIDAPEIDNPKYNRLGEYFGEESKEFLARKIRGARVRLESGYEPFDKYGRRLAYLYRDEELLNEEMVRRGYAEAIRFFDYEYKPHFLELEARAREQGLGMWGRPEGEEENEWFTALFSPGLLTFGILAVMAGWFYRKKI